ncbi:class I SAM-dependent methyltransferase [Maribacter sp.]|uniref:class I SAM-dependent methyltransferase n=1 Tax=Maribacter sp. TaxID=1897614 RepID=UPI0025BC82AF|nr:class I SAM-dependent methyltransferase [Maribacter sp.]
MGKQKKVPTVSVENLKEIAAQLSCPSGSEGKEIGELLHFSNEGMIKESVLSLKLKNNKRVLELGHGNCSHLPDLLKEGAQLRYFGMEISEVMQKEAQRINASYVEKGQALFSLYDGQKIPYVLNFFDNVFSVNTIYFWNNPVALLKEIYRVLKPNGKFVLTFVNSSCMEKLPFVAQTNFFELYDSPKIIDLVDKTDFVLMTITSKKEKVKSKTGDWVDRDYSIVVLTK